MTTKMKGLLKGLRYISQIFDDEKEPEMVIGFPTDVKHVAHIGTDGPSNAAPSWMTEYKSEGDNREEADKSSESGSVHKTSEGRRPKAHNLDMPEKPKPSRRHHASSNNKDSPKKGKPEKHRHARPASKGSPEREVLDSGRPQSDVESESGLNSPRKKADVPKKTRRKKSKETGDPVRKSKATTSEEP